MSLVVWQLGWVDLDLDNSPGWMAAFVATYCQSRMVEHLKSEPTQPNCQTTRDTLYMFFCNLFDSSLSTFEREEYDSANLIKQQYHNTSTLYSFDFSEYFFHEYFSEFANFSGRHIFSHPLKVILDPHVVGRLRPPPTRSPQHEAEDADQHRRPVARHREKWSSAVPEATRTSVYGVLFHDLTRRELSLKKRLDQDLRRDLELHGTLLRLAALYCTYVRSFSWYQLLLYNCDKTPAAAVEHVPLP